MLISREWLGDFVALPKDIDAATLAHDLTMHVVEVEGYRAADDGLSDCWVVGVVTEVGDDGRWLVDAGGLELTIDGVGAPPDLPIIVDLDRRRSCTVGELGLVGMLQADAASVASDSDLVGVDLGTAAGRALGLDDTVLEVDNKSLTNRPDLWSHHGVARELAAIYGLDLIDPPVLVLDPARVNPKLLDTVDERVANRYFVATIRPGSSPGRRSPLTIRSRLHRVGQRPLGLYADLTNYVMFAVGQPSHVYDADRVTLPLSVARGGTGPLPVLSGGTVAINGSTGVIQDADKAIGVAGIVGSTGTEVTMTTSSVVLEVGSFDAAAVRQDSLGLGVRTDASARFEKGLDTQGVDRARGYFLHLLSNFDPAAVVDGHIEWLRAATAPAEVVTTLGFLNTRMGTELTAAKLEELLSPLGFSMTIRDSAELVITAPTWRSTGDILIPNDVLEEAARSIGYDELPVTTLSIELRRPTAHGTVVLERRVRQFLAYRLHAQEVLTYPWVVDDLLARTGFGLDGFLRIDGAPSADRANLRPSLMPNLLGAVETNLPNRLRFRLFEVGTAYLGTAEAPELDRRVCAAFIGSDLLGEFRAAVGAVEGLARAARLADLQVVDPDPGGWGDVALRRDVVADGRWIGRIAAVDIDDAAGDRVAVFFELRLDEVRTLSSRENRYEPVSPHPEATVDLSVWVPDGVRWIDVESACLAAAVDHLQVVDFVDDFRDDAGRRSLTLRLRLSSQERTLSSEDKAAARQALVDVLTAKLGATERA